MCRLQTAPSQTTEMIGASIDIQAGAVALRENAEGYTENGVEWYTGSGVGLNEGSLKLLGSSSQLRSSYALMDKNGDGKVSCAEMGDGPLQ